VGYVLTVLGRRVYIAGDTDDTPEAAGVVCDIALLPIGGKYTMDPCQAAALAKRIRPAVVIPIHYGSVVGTEEAFDRFLAAAGGDVRVERAF
jgi:L-ascorbate metabolism protein UlaG (beta-lactamase superfamily)